ncbi:MTG2 GTPase, partial [Polypterus senegalus]
MGPGGLNPSGPSQTLHSQNNLNDSMASGLPSTSLMQSQMTNGPNHMPMQQSGQTSLPTTSMSMAVSSHSNATGYSHSVSSSQSLQIQSQGQSMSNYGSRTNLNMPSNQVSMLHQQAATSHYTSAQTGNQHYQGQQSIGMLGQGNQGNNMMAQRSMGSYRPSQQGHGDYTYQQSTYTEQSYERSFEESSQHYYEGANSKHLINRAQANNLPIHSSHTQVSRVTLDNSRDMVGFPNAGKSSLLRAISEAKPAVAAYPFTTLNPHVGVVQYRDHEQVAVADIPGIIRGAHENRGLGLSFLRHIERCRFLLFVIDLSVQNPFAQLEDLKFELEQYEKGLSNRPHAIVGNKIDLPNAPANLEVLRQKVSHRVIPVSALTGQNVEELMLHLRELYDGYIQMEDMAGRQTDRW